MAERGMSQREANAWRIIMYEIMKSEGIQWNNLTMFEQTEYSLKMDNALSDCRRTVKKHLFAKVHHFIAEEREGAE